MILPDINLLVYAYNSTAPRHDRAREWWQACLSSTQTVGLPWVVALGFLRITTSREVMIQPLTPAEALRRIRAWMERPQVLILHPGPRHLELLDELMGAAAAAGRLTTDAHLAALAIEHQAELHSNDTDFSRFPGLRWKNPLT